MNPSMPTFSESELTTIVNALTIAVEQFGKDAELCRASGQLSLEQQFKLQREQALKLIARIES